jgi:pyruvate/2-oxoglutarate dehydrogenase complex dihydrolipoamide acyltransferase (E2) component
MNARNSGSRVEPFPRNRLLMVDGGRLGRRRHTVHGLVEFGVAQARRDIRVYRAETGEKVSFSAFFLYCLGKAIDEDRSVHAYRDWRRRFVMFDEVDVNMLFEVDIDGVKTVRPHIIRGVNAKSLREIHEEITTFQSGHEESRESAFITSFVRLPGFLRRMFLRILFRAPRLIKDLYGTVLVTNVAMFEKGSGWGIPVPNHSLQLTLGGVAEKPGVVEHRVEARQYLSLTVSFDHDVVDGAPVARFTERLRRLVEKGYGLSASSGAVIS